VDRFSRVVDPRRGLANKEVPVSDEHLDHELDSADEYEEISSDEVDRIVEALEELAEGVASENIRVLLEEASQSVYDLVYDDEDLVEVDESDDLLADEDLLAEEDDDLTAEAA
jgi:hypothetical protein